MIDSHARSAQTRSGRGRKFLASVAGWCENLHTQVEVCSCYTFHVIYVSVLKWKFKIWSLFSHPVTYTCTSIAPIIRLAIRYRLNWPNIIIIITLSKYVLKGGKYALKVESCRQRLYSILCLFANSEAVSWHARWLLLFVFPINVRRHAIMNQSEAHLHSVCTVHFHPSLSPRPSFRFSEGLVPKLLWNGGSPRPLAWDGTTCMLSEVKTHTTSILCSHLFTPPKVQLEHTLRQLQLWGSK